MTIPRLEELRVRLRRLAATAPKGTAAACADCDDTGWAGRRDATGRPYVERCACGRVPRGIGLSA